MIKRPKFTRSLALALTLALVYSTAFATPGRLAITFNAETPVEPSQVERVLSQVVSEGWLRISITNQEGLKEFKQDLARQEINAKKFLAEFAKVRSNEVEVVVNSATWPVLPQRFQDGIRTYVAHAGEQEHQVGINVTLVVSRQDNLEEIAQKYAGERDVKPIVRYLEAHRQHSGGGFRIPLQSILAKVVRKEINAYGGINRSNCFNAGICVNLGTDYRKKYVGGVDGATSKVPLLKEINSVGYRSVLPTEPLRVGDFILYLSRSGEPVHGVSYAGDGVVFTKNGFSAINPYIFQTMDQVENIYFPDDQSFLVAVFRVPGPGELAPPLDDLLAVQYSHGPPRRPEPWSSNACERLSLAL